MIQEKLEATAKAQADQEKGNTEGGETQTYETSVFDKRVSEKAADAEKTDQTPTATKGQSAKSNDGAKDVSMPGGGGAPTLSPKGAGTGKNAVEAYANSGLSHQMAHKGNLGEKMSVPA